MPELPDDLQITVCSSCLTACCWQNEPSRICDPCGWRTATQRTVGELRALKLESEAYWERDAQAVAWRRKQEVAL